MQEDVARVMVDFTQMKAFSEDPLILSEGDGIRVRDVDGRSYIDGLSGTFCLSLGHGNARVVEAASAQLSRLALAAPTMATSDRSLELARELLETSRERAEGVYVIPPFRQPLAALDLF
jgi:4-aminobutyrate--pyruvate transaminase